VGKMGDPVDQRGRERRRQAGEHQGGHDRHHRHGDSPSWDSPVLKGHGVTDYRPRVADPVQESID